MSKRLRLARMQGGAQDVLGQEGSRRAHEVHERHFMDWQVWVRGTM